MTADGAIRGASAAFRDYLTEVGRDLAAGNATEHTHRPALKALLIALDPDVRPVNEPRRIECGAPDYIVTRNDLPVGYIEAKDVGRSLDEIERDEQLKRYRESLSNLILTDYLEFRWYKDGEKQQTARIAYVGDSGKLRPDREGQKQAAAMFSSFLAQEPPIVGKPEDLAKRMAALTRIVRDIVRSALEHDRSGGSPLREQLEGFRRVLIHDLGEEQFADMYAQTIAYGLFAARVNAPADEHFTRQHAAYDLPKTNPFLRQMFGQIAGPELDERIAWAVDDLAELLARARMDLVLEDFGKRTRHEDPVVHFYETFLAAYDRKMREARGVYYTPEPVVSYIVRSVDHILKTEFGLPDGLADNSMIEVPVPGKPKETRMVHKVQILDPACGTGTFLAQVIETIRDTVVAKHGAGMWPGYVHDHLLPRLYGFELLMAPYAIAHLKLGLRLKETGYDIEQSERLQVYLTNSLEEAHEHQHPQLSLFSTWLAEEADNASGVKRDAPVLVVLGNPPYSANSVNAGEWLAGLLHGEDSLSGASTASYFHVGGKPLGERNPKWLYDDYVKFLRFAHWRIDRTGFGVLAFVTNHGYLNNPTFRGMRWSLMQTFDEIRLLDLHGSSKKKEAPPGGIADANVFDIQQGVCIGVFVKLPNRGLSAPQISHAELWGDRKHKYDWLSRNDIAATDWTEIEPTAPFYPFVPVDRDLEEEYSKGWRLTDAFGLSNTGFITSRDRFAIGFSKDEVLGRVSDLLRIGAAGGREKYGLRDTRERSLDETVRLLASEPDLESHVQRCLYRPFDERWIFYHRALVRWPVYQVMRHFLSGENLALVSARSNKSSGADHFYCTRLMAETKAGEASTQSCVFPLYLSSEADHQPELYDGRLHHARLLSNLSPRFVRAASDALGRSFDDIPGQDQTGDVGSLGLFDYLYAIAHSVTYRERYSEFFKMDFPRIPLTSNRDLFRELCRLGSRLVTLHLMEADDLAPGAKYQGSGDNRVEKVRYTEPGQGAEQGRVWINVTQYFEGVPPEVWEFHVGGYQVCAKWLKDRKGRQLSYDDLTHYQFVVAALAETIELMREIDEVIEAHGGWPLS